MPDDARRITRTQAWLIKAQRDLAMVELALNRDNPFLDMAVYHCQQAAEKALKGFLFCTTYPSEKLIILWSYWPNARRWMKH